MSGLDFAAPHNGTETSIAAAKSLRPSLSAMRRRILDEVQSNGEFGITCDEIEQAMQLSHQTASARLRDLAVAGRVGDSGKRRPTRSGRNAIVWVSLA